MKARRRGRGSSAARWLLALGMAMTGNHYLAAPGAAAGADASAPAGPAAVCPRVSSLFGDHMVLQRDRPVRLWGWAEPGTRVAVTFAGQEKGATAGPDSLWVAVLEPLAASGQGRRLIARAGDGAWEQAFEDVVVGEVWLCSGQSNMGVPVSASDLADEEPAAFELPALRFRNVPGRVAFAPQEEVAGTWEVGSARSAPAQSAVALAMGCALARDLGVPVGMVHASHGGTVAEAFMSAEALASDPEFRPILETWERFAAEYPATEAERQRVAEERRQQVLARGEVPPPWPLEPKPPDHFHRASLLYNGMIHALTPFEIRGVAWYQGEANGWRAQQYRHLLPALIADWRRAWRQPDLPFLIVQLAPFEADWLEPEVWAELREAQALTWKAVPGTALVTAVDQGDPMEIHPREKREVGERLARAALAVAYGRQVEYAGPEYAGMEVEGSRVRVRFAPAGAGLVCRGDAPASFAVAGNDRVYHPAQARLEGEGAVVWAEEVAAPVAVRYGWANAPHANLYGASGLPVYPFRTDDWPGHTDGRVEPEAY